MTFDARLNPRCFWALVLIPPLVYWLVIEGLVQGTYGGHVNVWGLLSLIALAYGLPLAALGWTLCSVAAYTVEPGRLIVHRAVGDQVVALAPVQDVEQARDGTVRLRLPERVLSVCATPATGFFAALQAAVQAQPAPPAGGA